MALARAVPDLDPSPPDPWVPVHPPGGRLSTGIVGLDVACGGGYRVASVVAIELDPSAGPEDVSTLVLPALANHLSLGGGAVVAPPWGSPVQAWYSALLRHLPHGVVDGRLRVVDYAELNSSGSWHVPISRFGRVEDVNAIIFAERDAAGPGRRTILEVISVDALEAAFGEGATLRMMCAAVTRARQTGHASLYLTRSELRSAVLLERAADVHFRLGRAPTGAVLEGVRPSFRAVRIPPAPIASRS